MRFSFRDFHRTLANGPRRRGVSAVLSGTLGWSGGSARLAAAVLAALLAPSIQAQEALNLVSVTHAHAVFPAGYSCQMLPPADTIVTLLHATLRGTRPSGVPDTAWLRYQNTMLEAVQRAFALPHDIQLAAFSSPFPMPESPVNPYADTAPQPEAHKRRMATMTTAGSDSTTDIQGEQRGVLLDQEDNHPVPYATLSLAEAEQTRLTDSTGAWRITGIASGRYTLHVRRIGYSPKDTVVVVGPETSVRTDTIHISRAPVRLRPVSVNGKRPSTYVTLMLSTVVEFTLDAKGSLTDAHVAASSGSEPADTLVVASLRRAAATELPALPMATPQQPVTFDLVISMDEPPPDEESVVVGRVEGPVWASQSEAYLAESAHPDFTSGIGLKDDKATLQFVVDASGHPITSTARDAATPPEPVGYHPRPFEARVRDSLAKVPFTAAQVGACPVAQLVLVNFVMSVSSGH